MLEQTRASPNGQLHEGEGQGLAPNFAACLYAQCWPWPWRHTAIVHNASQGRMTIGKHRDRAVGGGCSGGLKRVLNHILHLNGHIAWAATSMTQEGGSGGGCGHRHPNGFLGRHNRWPQDACHTPRLAESSPIAPRSFDQLLHSTGAPRKHGDTLGDFEVLKLLGVLASDLMKLLVGEVDACPANLSGINSTTSQEMQTTHLLIW